MNNQAHFDKLLDQFIENVRTEILKVTSLDNIKEISFEGFDVPPSSPFHLFWGLWVEFKEKLNKDGWSTASYHSLFPMVSLP